MVVGCLSILFVNQLRESVFMVCLDGGFFPAEKTANHLTAGVKSDEHLYPSVKKNLTGLFQNLHCTQLLIISFTLLLKFIPKQLNGFIWPWFSWSHHCIRPKTQMVIHCIRPKTQIVIQPIQVVILWSQTHQQNYKDFS